MTYALVSLCVLLVLLLTSAGVWLHAEVSEGKHVRDRLDEQMKVSAEYQHQRDVAVAELAVKKDQLAQEQQLRAVAEAARDVAQKRVRNELIKHAKDATEEEIDALTAELFAPSLVVVQPSKAADRRPGSDDLIDPVTEV